jgi:hypothetical protein
MSKLTADDIVPGELYVFTSPAFPSWIGLVARAIHRYKPSSRRYLFELVKLPDETQSIGPVLGAQLVVRAERFERYPRILSASDQLFS